MRLRWILLTILGVVILLPIAAIIGFIATFDANAWRPRIQDAVFRATGREIAFNGPLSLKFSLIPTLQAEDVAIANIPGGSRPQMATLGRLEAQVALIPLLSHRIELRSVVLEKPDILLETTADGQPNWIFRKPPATTSPAAPSAAPGQPLDLIVYDVKVNDGTLTWHNGLTGQSAIVALKSFEATTEGPDSPTKFALQAAWLDQPITASGETGPLSRLRDEAATSPFPIRLAISSGAATATLAGQATHPLRGQGYSFRLDARLPDLAQLQPFVSAALPPVHDLAFAAIIADNSGTPLPDITALTLQAGASDLSAYAPGLTLAHAEINAPKFDQPITVAADGSYAGAPLKLAATIGAPAALLAGANFPVDISAEAAGATATVKGSFADPARQAGADLAIAARIPDLAAFAPLARTGLPGLKMIAFDAHLAEAQGGFLNGIVLKDASLTLPQGDLAGDAAIAFAAHPSITATLASKKLDLEALLDTAIVEPPPPPQIAGQPPVPPPAPPAPPPAIRRTADRLIPTAPIPFAALRDADADLQLRIAELHSAGETHRDIVGHLKLVAGKLDLDPISGAFPAGRMSGRLSVDANPPAPPVALVLHAPGLSLRALAVMLDLPSDASGALEVDADLRGAGDSLHAIASTLNGSLGLSMVNGEVDARLLNNLLGPILSSASLPFELLTQGRNIGHSPLRCFAMRLDARNGLGSFRALYLDASRIKISGSGTINFADEALALQLRPLARLAETGITVPLRVGGTLANPRARVDAAGAASANVAGVAETAGALAGMPLNALSGALGGGKIVNDGDDCAAQLAIARNGREGPLPNTAATLLSAPAQKAQDIIRAPGNVLRQLFNR